MSDAVGVVYQDLDSYKKKYSCKSFSPLKIETITDVENKIGPFPKELKDFYKLTNGLETENFRIIPIFDLCTPKLTWDSLERENDFKTSKFSLDKKLLSKFLIFSEIGALHCGMYDRSDFSIWYEDDDGYHRTKLHLKEFIELNLMEEPAYHKS